MYFHWLLPKSQNVQIIQPLHISNIFTRVVIFYENQFPYFYISHDYPYNVLPMLISPNELQNSPIVPITTSQLPSSSLSPLPNPLIDSSV